MFARYASAVTTGTLITCALLYAMQGLINLQPGAESEPRPRTIVDWINLSRQASPPPPPAPDYDKETITSAPIPPTGWVDVCFDVMTSGQVTNIQVTGSSHGIFEKSALQAAQKFRFRAPVVDGVPQVATNVNYRFRFEMNN
jgi:TonB family protein